MSEGKGRDRTYADLRERTASDIEGQLAAKQERLRRRLADVRRTVAIMSGKGGVGKSVVTAALAAVLADDGLEVGVLDADLNGPSMARLLGAANGPPPRVSASSVQPATGVVGVRVMSMDLLLPGDDAPLEWSGPERERHLWRSMLEANAIREFLADTEWGRLDYLLIDLPPGTGNLTALHDVLPSLGGVVAVTLPTRLSRFVVGKSLTLARRLELPLIGYVENMAGYVCGVCGSTGPLFDADAGRDFAGIPKLAALPFDSTFGRETDEGHPDVLTRPDSAVGQAIRELARRLRTFFEDGEQ